MNSATQGAKRGLDVVVAVVALALQLPLLPLVALALFLESPGPLFVFRPAVGLQRRRPRTGAGAQDLRRVHDMGGALVWMAEFRLTTLAGDGEAGRLTHVGRLLLRTGFARAPGFFNVLMGELSLMGPRPLAPRCVSEVRSRIPEWDSLLAGVKPGFLGPAPTHGWPASDWVSALRDRVLFDLGYVERLRRAERVVEVLALDLSLVWAWCRRIVRWRSPAGREVVRIDAPARLRHAALDVSTLLTLPERARAPQEPATELLPHASRLTAFWYPARRAGLRVPASCVPHAEADLLRTEEQPFEARTLEVDGQGDCQLVVVHALRADPALTAAPPDELHLDLPGGLHEVGHLCAQLCPLWETLGARRGDAALASRMTRLLLAGLARVATGRADGRIMLDIHVAADRIALYLAARPPLPGPVNGRERTLPRVARAPALRAMPAVPIALAARVAMIARGLSFGAGGQTQCPAHDTSAEHLRPR